MVDNLLVGLIGGFQPDKVASAFAGDEDGMYGRFLYGWPATPPYNPLTDDILEVDPEFKNLLTKLIRLPSEDENGKFNPPRFCSPRKREKNSRSIGASSIRPNGASKGVNSNG